MRKAEALKILEEIRNCILVPGEYGYLVNATFVNKLSGFNGTKPPKIQNKELFQNGSLKPRMEQDNHYYAVTKEIWDELMDKFGGGPEKKCMVLENGSVELYLLQANVTCGKRNANFEISRSLTMLEFATMIKSKFELNGEWGLYALKGSNEIPLDGTAGEQLVGQTRLEVHIRNTQTPTQPQPARPQQQQQKKKGAKASRTTPEVVPYSPGKGPCGLKNLGNTCYMNSALQSLMCSESLMANMERIASEADRPKLTPVFIKFLLEAGNTGRLINPQFFKNAIADILPFLKGKTQEDLHEFTTFMLDILKEECSKKRTFDSLFFGAAENEMICAECGESRIINETFSSISVPISESRRAVFSPYDLSKPMEKICGVPDVPAILIGRKQDGKNMITDSMRPEFVEVHILEKPEEREGMNVAIMRVVDKTKKPLITPLLLQVPINVPISQQALEDLVCERIKPLCPGKLNNVELMSPPEQFTMSESNLYCREMLVVSIGQKLNTARNTPQIGAIPVNELIDRYFSEVVLDVDNKWKCEKCGEESCAFHKSRLVSCPKNLIIQLKRFKMKGARFQRDDSEVIVSQELDLSRYFKSGISNSARYELRAIANHIGTLSAGHYTANGRRGDKWYHFNDASVTVQSPPPGASKAAYVIYYERVDK